MATIRCPSCGSPVMIRGNQWEFGWCCNSGDISSLSQSDQAEFARARFPALTRSFSLSGIWQDIQGSFRKAILDEDGVLTKDLKRVILHEAAIALQHTEISFIQTATEELARFFEAEPDLENLTLLSSLRSAPAPFADVAALSEDVCGSFWQGQLPSSTFYEGFSESLREVLFLLGDFYEGIS